ncbi:MAG: hypothetical protein ABFC65_00755 [Rectinema sp.]
MSSRSKHRVIFAIIIAVLLVLVCFVVWYPAGGKEAPPAGYSPLRDDDLAARYRPVFVCPTEFGPILAVYYRAAQDDSGLIHIAYHPLWAGERNNTKAFWPFLSRILYTGGLSLQRLMYGPGDIETIGLAIDPASGKIVEVEYETAADYDPSRFGVKHQEVSLKGSFDPPLHFRVISWNHLFRLEEDRAAVPGTGVLSAELASGEATSAELASDEASSAEAAPLSYFTPELWAKYAIWKNPETILRKDRAHFPWERAVVPQAF